MIIKYKFSTGEVTEVEVSEEIGTVILDSRREEHASNERHRYHTAFSLDDMDYEDKDYFSAADNPEKAFMEKEFAKKREAMLSQLTPVQRRRFELFEDGMTVAEIARKEKSRFQQRQGVHRVGSEEAEKTSLIFLKGHPQFRCPFSV